MIKIDNESEIPSVQKIHEKRWNTWWMVATTINKVHTDPNMYTNFRSQSRFIFSALEKLLKIWISRLLNSRIENTKYTGLDKTTSIKNSWNNDLPSAAMKTFNMNFLGLRQRYPVHYCNTAGVITILFQQHIQIHRLQR